MRARDYGLEVAPDGHLVPAASSHEGDGATDGPWAHDEAETWSDEMITNELPFAHEPSIVAGEITMPGHYDQEVTSETTAPCPKAMSVVTTEITLPARRADDTGETTGPCPKVSSVVTGDITLPDNNVAPEPTDEVYAEAPTFVAGEITLPGHSAALEDTRETTAPCPNVPSVVTDETTRPRRQMAQGSTPYRSRGPIGPWLEDAPDHVAAGSNPPAFDEAETPAPQAAPSSALAGEKSRPILRRGGGRFGRLPTRKEITNTSLDIKAVKARSYRIEPLAEDPYPEGEYAKVMPKLAGRTRGMRRRRGDTPSY